MNQENYKHIWEKLLTPWRYQQEAPDCSKIDPARSPFIQDYDRLVFSDSFRRLAGKTQVHPLNTNDHIHTRLSHSIEVASVGRGLGTRVAHFLKSRGDLPDFIEVEHIGEIVSCACMAHDVGNPPFGHAGEKAIQDWFKAPENKIYMKKLRPEQWADFCHFDGNAQGFRIVNVLENDKQQGGFRLTYPTIASLVKYPNNSLVAEENKTSKFNFYTSEKKLFTHIFTKLGLNNATRHPLSYLMEAADDTCYRIIDMEDARELGILTYTQILEAIEPIKEKMNLDFARMEAMHSDRSRVSYVRSKLIGVLASAIFDAFKEQYENIMQDILTQDIVPKTKEASGINALIKYTSPDIQAYMKNAKDIFKNIIMLNKQTTALEIGSYSVYKRLLDTFIPAVHARIMQEQAASTKNASSTPNAYIVSYKDERALTLLDSYTLKKNVTQNTIKEQIHTSEPQKLHAQATLDDTLENTLYYAYQDVIDFISGMTDSYASFLSSQFAGHNSL